MPSDNSGQPATPSRMRRMLGRLRRTVIHVGTMLTVRAAFILTFALLFLWLPAPWLWQFVQTRLDDQAWLYDASKEGLIVVDSPQIFTRERLVNQRLRDSDWIDRQLLAVDEKLKKGEFGTPDTISASQRLLKIYQEAAQAQTPGAGAVDLDKLQAMMRPDPLTVFEDAQMYREMLTQNRYETILDDAHDIGSNTLQRLNFRMTLSPARAMSDSLAAVTITIDEPAEPEWLFHHYGRLLVETREELEETVARLVADRSRIFTQQMGVYGLHPKSEAAKNAIFARVFTALYAPGQDGAATTQRSAQSYQRDLIALVLDYQRQAETQQIEALVVDYVTNSAPWTGLGDKLLARSRPRDFLSSATEVLKGSCDQPVSLWMLAADHLKDPVFYNELLQDYARVQPLKDSLRPSGPPAAPEPAAVSVPRPTAVPTSVDMRSEAQFREFLHRFLPPIPCRRDLALDLPRAKLQLVGIMEIVNGVLAQDPLCAGRPPADRHHAIRAAAHVLMSPDPARLETDQDVPQACRGLVQEVRAMTDLMVDDRTKASGLQRIGVAHMILEELQETAGDTVARRRGLADYFDIGIDTCDLTSCNIAVRTFAEAHLQGIRRALDPMPDAADPKADLLADAPADKAVPQPAVQGAGSLSAQAGPRRELGKLAGSDGDPGLMAERIGREEALRLFAELSCFSTARSYTVWPRTGARQQMLQTEQDGVSLISQALNPLGVAADAQSSVTRRRHIDKVFGIGDGGQPVDTPFRECDGPFFWMLNMLQPDGRFIERYLDKGTWNGADSAILAWRDQRTCLLGVASRIAPWYDLELTRPDGRAFASEEARVAALVARCADPASVGEVPKEATDRLVKSARLHDVATYTRRLRQRDTNISWIVAPEQMAALSPSAHVARSIPLSAIVSVPSWWPSARITIRTCWLRPADLMRQTQGADFCRADPMEDKRTGFQLLDRRIERLAAAGRTETTVTIPLPSNAQDVLPKLGFFLIRAPYLDQWEFGPIEVESGRSAQIRLTGSRLWKNPRVRLGAQWHDKIEVLPDMKGIIATFNCVTQIESATKARVHLSSEPLIKVPTDRTVPDGTYEAIQKRLPPPGIVPAEAYTADRQAQVWTSEGVTGNTLVKVRAFRPSYLKDGGFEQPCWANPDELDDKSGRGTND
ncbi:hypothetical protein [Roseobacter sinensis]|uniref:Uncharacterized protein n=1 Tax=Roseobacter sinensis TaxID=2931391 RepID=A0ABT3BHU7_9RHOB|nr:hypothetical protein [Roseobacter sp. WL0113]MCV3272768.1 hypothetical protein [Roseobacter sp. WL0113]